MAAEELEADESIILPQDTWQELRRDAGACCDLLEVTEDQG